MWFPMIRTLGWIMLCLCVVFGIGLYFGWFSISASNADLQLSINKDKIHEDADALKK